MNLAFVTVFGISVFAAILFGSLSLDAALADPQPKVTICHVDQETGDEKTITVGAPAVSKHLANHQGDHLGPCVEEPPSCVVNDECLTEEYCAKPTGADPSSEGVCQLKPTGCTREFVPVCGVDGNTYSNDCVAASEGVNIDHFGSCNGPFPFP